MGPHKSTWHRQCLTCTIPCFRPRPGLEVSKNSVAWTVSWSRWTGSALSSFRTWTPNQPLLSKASPSRSPTPSRASPPTLRRGGDPPQRELPVLGGREAVPVAQGHRAGRVCQGIEETMKGEEQTRTLHNMEEQDLPAFNQQHAARLHWQPFHALEPRAEQPKHALHAALEQDIDRVAGSQ